MSASRNIIGKFVCLTCLEDEGLMQFAKAHGCLCRCDYCMVKPDAPIVVAVDKLAKEMDRVISLEWCEPADESMAESDSEYMDSIYNVQMLFERIEFRVSNSTLMSDFLKAFSDREWCRKSLPHSSPSTRWADAWEAFKSCVKYERRYTFWQADANAKKEATLNAHGPSSILYQIKALLNKSCLVKAVKPGACIWRVQVFPKGEAPKVPERFTSPPLKYAQTPNRMSPAGVPMFYGADDWETACRELVNPWAERSRGNVAIGVQFRNLFRMNILDLTLIPKRLSYFVSDESDQKYVMDFLREFAEDLSIPIKKGAQQQIEYVPTQVFTEFVRFMMKGPRGVPIHGIRYASSRTNRPCWVIFATHAECLPQPKIQNVGPRRVNRQQILEFVPNSIKTVELPWTNPKLTPP